MMIECSKKDMYSNTCCISYVYLMFSALLRNYSQTIQFYNHEMGSDFSLVLQYIQHNYQTLTLSSLAELFHYSEPYLCTLINSADHFSRVFRSAYKMSPLEYRKQHKNEEPEFVPFAMK